MINTGIPKPIIKSTLMLRRVSAFEKVNDLSEEMIYRRRQMQREAVGIPMLMPMINFEAVGDHDVSKHKLGAHKKETITYKYRRILGPCQRNYGSISPS